MRVVRSLRCVVSFISVIVVVIASLAFVWALLASSRQAFIGRSSNRRYPCAVGRRQCWQSSRGSSRLTGVWWGSASPIEVGLCALSVLSANINECCSRAVDMAMLAPLVTLLP